jgi:hypothetical protein
MVNPSNVFCLKGTNTQAYFWCRVSDKDEKLNNIETWVQCYKTFCGRIYEYFQRASVCPWHTFPAKSNVRG